MLKIHLQCRVMLSYGTGYEASSFLTLNLQIMSLKYIKL